MEERATLLQLVANDAPTWLQTNFYVPDARDPETGEELGPGKIRLAEHQIRIMRAALTRVNGRFPFTTIVYSAVKKSGKTRVAAGVVSWFAATSGPYNEIYCVANDGRQSIDRLLSAVKQAIRLAEQHEPSLPIAQWHITKSRVELPSGTFIEAIPCDPSGQAGSNPGMTAWSEMWGFRHNHKERLWSEMTIPPTRWGKAIRWVESYAGFTGESHVLEDLYNLGIGNSRRHPSFPDLPIYINDPASLFCYWDHIPRMPWQTPEYYAQEAQLLTPDEFRRIHKNEWVDPVEKAIHIEWWDACQDVVVDGEPLPPLGKREPAIMGIDASESHDCCAAVVVTRHPKRRNETAIRRTRIWKPPVGGKINLTETVEKFIREMHRDFNIIMLPYDKYQMHKMATDLRCELGIRTFDFSQAGRRAMADKMFFEQVLQKQITHDGHSGLREHVDNAAIKHSTTTGMRFIKPDKSMDRHGRTQRPIDALIAASMANFECLRLNLD